MKTLSREELTRINGGASDSYHASDFWGSVGIGNLVSYSNESRDGDEYSSSSGSIGNGISLDLGSMFHSITD